MTLSDVTFQTLEVSGGSGWGGGSGPVAVAVVVRRT